MVPRRLGRTGLMVSPIGFGAFKIGRNEKIKYPSGYDLPTDAQVAELIAGALDLGINYFDTAPAYGISEQRLGRVLDGREDVIISTKVGETFEHGRSTYDFSAAAIRASVERSLRHLRRERLDIVLIHAHGDDVQILRETDAVETLHTLRDEGKMAFVGLSGKTCEAGRLACEWADVLMVEYNQRDRDCEPMLELAAERDVGVVVKKALASGTLPADEALAFVLRRPEVASVVVGTLNLDHLRDNVHAAET